MKHLESHILWCPWPLTIGCWNLLMLIPMEPGRKRLTVVEASGVPHPVVPSAPSVEVHAVCAIIHADAVIGVLAGMAVHNVNQHNQAQPVRLVYQRLQLIWASKPAAGLHTARQIVFSYQQFEVILLFSIEDMITSPYL